jgi:hypothetical protein
LRRRIVPCKMRDKCPVCLDLSPYLAIVLHIAPDKATEGRCLQCAFRRERPQ